MNSQMFLLYWNLDRQEKKTIEPIYIPLGMCLSVEKRCHPNPTFRLECNLIINI